MMKFGLLGAGRIGQVHAKAISRNGDAELVAVADALPEAAVQVAKTYGAEQSSVAAMETASDLDAVLICTPTDTHADLIERFARAGKAIFCEKPVDLSPERVKTCLQTVAREQATLMIGFNRRFDPHFVALKAAIDAGDIGEVEQLTLTSRDPGLPPQSYIATSGGIFRDMTIHDFDMARFLLAEEVTEVFATASVLVETYVGDLGDYDTATVVMRTASDKQVIISNSRRARYGYDQRIEVHGSLGMAHAENQRPADIEVATAAGFVKQPLHGFFMDRYIAAYEAEITAFVQALKGAAPVCPTGQDGLAALYIAEAANRSVLSGRCEQVVWDI